MKSTKRFNLFIVLLFIAAISLPLVFADFEGGKVSVSENRYLATFPDIFTAGRLTFSPSAFDNWINDNIGGRSLAQKIEGKIDYSLTQNHKGDVIEGKDDWLFLLPSYEIPEYINTNLPTDDNLQQLVAGYERIAAGLNEQEIEFVLAMYPRKFHVYSEYMPDTLTKLNETSAYTMISEALKQSDVLHFVDPFDALMEAKEGNLTYCKARDASHWNNYGAFIGYQCLMEQVKKVIPSVRVLTEDDFIITEETFETEKENGFSASETDYIYQLKNNQTVQDMSHLIEIGFKGTDPWQSYRYFKNTDSSLPKAIIVGDSYTWMFQLDYLSQSFSELAFIHHNDLSQLNWLIDCIQPDVVIMPFLSSAIWVAYTWEPASVLEQPIVDYGDWGYHCIDYMGTIPANNNVLTVNADEQISLMEGWALDPLAGTVAGRVIVQVGDKHYMANYGKARESVSSTFQNEAYTNSGYTIALDTQELISAGCITVHVISLDGSYQYPPATYTILTQ